MDFVALIGIAVGLSKDAFAVSVTNGAVCQKNNLKFAAKLALSFGFFQALMPTIGWLAGKAAENLFLPWITGSLSFFWALSVRKC